MAGGEDDQDVSAKADTWAHVGRIAFILSDNLRIFKLGKCETIHTCEALVMEAYQGKVFLGRFGKAGEVDKGFPAMGLCNLARK